MKRITYLLEKVVEKPSQVFFYVGINPQEDFSPFDTILISNNNSFASAPGLVVMDSEINLGSISLSAHLAKHLKVKEGDFLDLTTLYNLQPIQRILLQS